MVVHFLQQVGHPEGQFESVIRNGVSDPRIDQRIGWLVELRRTRALRPAALEAPVDARRNRTALAVQNGSG